MVQCLRLCGPNVGTLVSIPGPWTAHTTTESSHAATRSLHAPAKNGEGGLVAKSCLTLMTPWTVAYQAPLSMGFSRQEYWSGLPFPSPGDLPNPGLEPGSPAL